MCTNSQSEGEGTKKEENNDSREDQKMEHSRILRSLSIAELLDLNRPWVLIPDGSFGGYFNWVPKNLRVGPWSTAAICYMTVICYGAVLGAAFLWSQPRLWSQTDFDTINYPDIGTWPWYYNVLTACWMMYVMKMIIDAPVSYRAWSTYTVQSWTLLTIRHILAALSPISRTALVLAEVARFPAAVSPTLTFSVWNFIIAPFVYFVGMKSQEQKKQFISFCTSFRLTNLHILNIVFCVVHLLLATPKRILETADFYLAVISVVLYMAWYLLLLDRIGVHLYPVFSPRAGTAMVVGTWTILLCVYVASFVGWKKLMLPQSSPQL